MQQGIKNKIADDKRIDELTAKVNNAIKNMDINIVLFGKEVDRVRKQKDKEGLEENYSKPFFSQYIKELKRKANNGWNSGGMTERAEELQQFLERKQDGKKI